MSAVRLAVLLSVLAACGRIGFDATSTASFDVPRGDGPPASCASNYTFTYGSSRYRASGTDQWKNSELDCESDGPGMHLIVIDDMAELAAIAPLAASTVSWIGTSDRITAGTWRDVTGPTATYLPWGASQPAAFPCVSMDPANGTLSAEDCTLGHKEICECDGIIVDKTSY